MSTANTVYHKQPELWEPSHYLDCDTGPGFFSLLTRQENGRFKQKSYSLSVMPLALQAVNPAFDTWISQASFIAPNRRAVNLRSLQLLFADLDTYKIPGFSGLSAENLVALLLNYCAAEGVPPPSVVLFSGRGLQAKWLLDEAVRRASILRWNDLQRALGFTLEGFASDPRARDVSRVLRLEHTVNTRTGEVCRVVHVQGRGENPARYSLEDLEAALLPRLPSPPPLPQTPRIRSQLCQTTFPSLAALAWARLEDIRKLWQLRGGVVEGYRETTLFWSVNFLMLATPVPVSQFWYEAQSLAAEYYPGDWYKESSLTTVYTKAKEFREGARVIYGGRSYPPLYTPKNETLAEVFQITPDEEHHLTTIISQGEKVRRRREQRWAEGTRPLSESVSRTRPWEAEGISRRTWYRRRSGQ